MTFADQNAFKAMQERLDALEQRVAELEAKKTTGRPKKDEQEKAA